MDFTFNKDFTEKFKRLLSIDSNFKFPSDLRNKIQPIVDIQRPEIYYTSRVESFNSFNATSKTNQYVLAVSSSGGVPSTGNTKPLDQLKYYMPTSFFYYAKNTTAAVINLTLAIQFQWTDNLMGNIFFRHTLANPAIPAGGVAYDYLQGINLEKFSNAWLQSDLGAGSVGYLTEILIVLISDTQTPNLSCASGVVEQFEMADENTKPTFNYQ